MKTTFYKSEDRGEADFGWFQARYSFSFGQYYDPQRTGFGTLRVLNDSIIQSEQGFPEHPHENFEIITVQFQGDLLHTDISGTRHIRTHDVQAISAGTGVTHSDVNVSKEEARQFQIWVEPSQFNVVPQSNIHHFEPGDWDHRWKTLVAPVGSQLAPLEIYQDAYLSRGVFSSGTAVEYTLKNAKNGVFLMVIDGTLIIDQYTLGRRDAVGITDTRALTFKPHTASDILLVEVPVKA